MRTSSSALALLVMLIGCDPPIDIEEPAERCEGLDLDNCLLPWPSSRYLVSDPSTATGYRIALPADAMPVNVVGVPVDPGPWNRWDGFSAMTSAIAQLPVPIDPSGLVDYRHVERSLEPSSPTVLLDATTNTLVAHFAEIEAAADADPTRTTIYVRPAARLAEGHRYVVALRNLRTPVGEEVPPSQAFAALRDRRETTSERLEARRPAFERDVFAPLSRAGVRRSSLVLAWDFVTASGASAWGDLRAMRDDAVARAGTTGLGCSVTEVVEDPEDPHVWRRIEGTFSVPSYLDTATGVIARDASGAPTSTGNTEVAFTAIVPRSVRAAIEGGTPTRSVLFGHGLLSSRQEMLQDFMLEQADRDRMVLVGTDLTGLAAGDEAVLVPALIDLNGFGPVMDRIAQSVIAHLLLPRTIAGRCSDLAAFRADNLPFVDGSQRYYYGLSQGGNFGPTYAALSDDVDRFVMGVGGISFPIQITRSVHWPMLEQVLAAGYASRIERDTLMVMFAHHWDRVEGSTYAPHVTRDPLAGGPKHVLAQIGLYDVQTPNEGSHLMARTMGLPQASTDAAPITGLPAYTGTSPDAVVTFDTGAAAVPPSTVPPAADNGVHEAVRRDPRAQAQIDAFLRPGGVVTDACGGPCDP